MRFADNPEVMTKATLQTAGFASRESAGWLRWKTPVFLFLVICSNLFGDVCLRFGLRQGGNFLKQSLSADAHAVCSIWVGAGMAFYLIWMLAQMALFSWADLTFVMPITSI